MEKHGSTMHSICIAAHKKTHNNGAPNSGALLKHLILILDLKSLLQNSSLAPALALAPAP